LLLPKTELPPEFDVEVVTVVTEPWLELSTVAAKAGAAANIATVAAVAMSFFIYLF
jgi:hypothetical protein